MHFGDLSNCFDPSAKAHNICKMIYLPGCAIVYRLLLPPVPLSRFVDYYINLINASHLFIGI